MITLKILDSLQDITTNINKAIAAELNVKLLDSRNSVTTRIKQLVNELVESQPEIQSLRDGALKGAFGIVDSDSAIISILESILSNTEVNLKKFDHNLNGGLTINIQPSSFQNLLGLPRGFTIYSKGVLHWLDWLLMRGDTIIVTDYQYNPKTGLGRSGLGNMIGGGSFRVPPQFSGSDNDNFITRALLSNEAESQITSILESVLS